MKLNKSRLTENSLKKLRSYHYKHAELPDSFGAGNRFWMRRSSLQRSGNKTILQCDCEWQKLRMFGHFI